MQLLAEGLELEEFGGDVQCVQTAAKAGTGLRELEESLLLQVGAVQMQAWGCLG
jgi:translation initiation factor IF-2